MSAKSWDEVEITTIFKSWGKLLRCGSLDVSDKNSESASNSDDVDVDSLLNDMEVPLEERTDWLAADKDGCGYHQFSEEEIVSIARDEDAENGEEENDDDKITPPTISHASACQALQSFTYLEQQPSASMQTMVILNGLLLETARE